MVGPAQEKGAQSYVTSVIVQSGVPSRSQLKNLPHFLTIYCKEYASDSCQHDRSNQVQKELILATRNFFLAKTYFAVHFGVLAGIGFFAHYESIFRH